MTQTVNTISVPAGLRRILLEKPYIMRRVFFSVRVVLGVNTEYPLYLSLGDPNFLNYYRLSGQDRYFEAKGDDIFQGIVWASNKSTIPLNCTMMEILH